MIITIARWIRCSFSALVAFLPSPRPPGVRLAIAPFVNDMPNSSVEGVHIESSSAFLNYRDIGDDGNGNRRQ
jgi:hypothetical protein